MYRSPKVAFLTCILLGLAACGGKDDSAAPADASVAPEAVQSTGAAVDAAPAATDDTAAPAATPDDTAATAPPTDTTSAAPQSDLDKAGPKYSAAIETFRNAGESAQYFDRSYGFAVFPTIGKAGLGVGGAHGKGRAYVGGAHVGDTTLNQLSIGLQAGAQAYSEIVFFEDERAFREFSSGSFEFAAGVSAVAITAGVAAGAGTTGASATASTSAADADTAAFAGYHKGMAVFTVAKGGLMYEASVAGQKFGYKPH